MTLADSIEQAEGPSRELDAMIHFHITNGVGCGAAQDAPAYTASIDAALTLVPKGWVRRNSQIRFGMWQIQLWHGDKSFWTDPDVSVIAASEALAICAAALRTGENNGR